MTVPFSVLIPTLDRGETVLETVAQLRRDAPAPAEIFVLDQTVRHPTEVADRLAALDATGAASWVRLDTPSQPAALNVGLARATQPFVLMLDDDIRIEPGLVEHHRRAYDEEGSVWAVAGSVLQPGQSAVPGPERRSGGALRDLDFPFNSDTPAWVANGMSGNLSVRRERALSLGGFDRNFVPPVAYRFDADLCARLVEAGGRIRYEPRARIHHLRLPRGGTRSIGSHLTSASPLHGVGDYYYALRHATGADRFRYVARRPFREVATRFHLRHPWWILPKLVGELRALAWAARLVREGPRLELAKASAAHGRDVT